MQYWFYHLQNSSLEATLPQILEKILSSGETAKIIFSDQALMTQIDDFLWHYKSESFLPHGRDDMPKYDNQPIQLSCSQKVETDQNGGSYLIAIGSAEPIFDAQPKFKRFITFVDSRDEAGAQVARSRWRQAKAAGADVAYWKQNEQGAWQKH